MKITYDSEVDALYIRFKDPKIFKTITLQDLAFT